MNSPQTSALDRTKPPTPATRRNGPRTAGDVVADRWRAAAWIPLGLVIAMIVTLEMAALWAHGRPREALLPFGGAELEWLVMSGNGFILSWALLCWHGQTRARGRVNEPDDLLPGLISVALLTLWALTFAERTRSWNLTSLTIIVFGPTLLISYILLGTGLRRVKSFRTVVALALGAGVLNALCQLGYFPIRETAENRLLPLDSIFLGAMIGARLTIWWTTDEGFSAPPTA